MSNYFATLAARATVSPEPTPVAANAKTIVDPFEQTAPSVVHSEEVPSEKARTIQHEQALRLPDSDLHSPIPRKQEESTVIRTGETRELSGKTLLAKSNSDRASETQLRPPGSISGPAIEHAHESESDKSTQHEQKAILPAKPLSVQTLTPNLAGEVSHAMKAEEDESGDESDQAPREESMLLRKADDFMRKLFEDRLPAQPASYDQDKEVEQPPVLKPKSQSAELPRLHPRQPDERMFEREVDRPSLVIGRLTVEVTPPPPAQTAPRQPVVVVHRARSARSGISSSRRFGLSQL